MEKDNDHLLVMVLRKSGTLSVKIVHKENAFGSSHFAQTSVAHAQGEVHSGVVVLDHIFASPSAVPWCARDGLQWTFLQGGSSLCADADHSRRNGPTQSNGSLALFSCSPRSYHNTGSRPRCGTRCCKPTGDQVRSRVARNGRLRGTRGCRIEIFFEKARVASRSKPLQDQIAETAAFISRAKKRLSVLEEERVREQELLDKALVRQERLLREMESEREEQPCTVPDVTAQFHRLEAIVAELKKERDDLWQKVEERRGVWMANELPDVDRVPPIPSEEQLIYDWLSSRNCELRNALEFGDHRTVSKLSSLLVEGCGASLGATESMDTSSRSDLMAGLIRDGDAKRRCLLGQDFLPPLETR